MTTFVHFYFITMVWICAFFILNLTIALMLMKYEEVEGNKEELEHDFFEEELDEIGDSVFGT
jgi:hypothetical protein